MVSAPNETPKAWLSGHVWTICGLLLCASAINYMDRQTLASASVRITTEMHLSEEQYGNLEGKFGLAFAVGSLFFGFVADMVPVRWLYPMVLLLWSGVGFATGWVTSYEQLLACRIALGFFEAGHWPCGLKAVRTLMSHEKRSLGNSLLQSGTSLGAIMTPLIMRLLLTEAVGSWRLAFQIVGGVGLLWIVAWFWIVGHEDLAAHREQFEKPAASNWLVDLIPVVFQPRMLVLFFITAMINTQWQVLRAWLPKLMQQGRGYTESNTLLFNSLWFAATDVGCILAGIMVVWLNRRGWHTIRAQQWTFTLCAAASLSLVALPWVPTGPVMLILLLLAGAGSLGVFPIYYALMQRIAGRHQGKVTGITGVAAWCLTPWAQKQFGRYVDTHIQSSQGLGNIAAYDHAIAAAVTLSTAACAVLWLCWGRDDDPPKTD